MALFLSGDPDADAFLSEDPLALLIGMVLDQQVPLEKAFRSPYDLRERLGGSLDAAAVAAMDPDKLAELFSARPALHRFPTSMAARVQELCVRIVDTYGGDAAAVWHRATTGEELFENVKALPGFGDQKAHIFVALLGKQLGVRPPGWEEAAGTFGEQGSFRSVADIHSAETLAKVRRYKQEKKAQAKADSDAGKAAAGRSKSGPSRSVQSKSGPSRSVQSKSGRSKSSPSRSGVSNARPSKAGPSKAGPSKAG